VRCPDVKALAATVTKGAVGGSDLGGEQTRRPEHQRMTAASKYEPALKSPCGTKLSADLVLTQGRP